MDSTLTKAIKRIKRRTGQLWPKKPDHLTYHQFKKKMAMVYLGGLCQECGVDYSDRQEVYQFDHLERKKAGINVLLTSGADWRTVRAELDKCELVCHNCHDTRTSAGKLASQRRSVTLA